MTQPNDEYDEATLTERIDMRQVIEECTKRILEMVEWHVEDRPPNDNTPLGPLSEESLTKIGELRPTPEQVAESGEEGGNVALGRYFKMAPRGSIELYWEPIGSFFWHIAVKMLRRHPNITAYQLSRLAAATVAKTALHEMFHYHADVLTILFRSRRRFPDEEAFAVAASYHAVASRTGRIGWWKGVPDTLREDFLDLAYHYDAPGYRDWVNYKDHLDYEAGVFEYLVHPAVFRLLKAASPNSLLSGGVNPTTTVLRQFAFLSHNRRRASISFIRFCRDRLVAPRSSPISACPPAHRPTLLLGPRSPETPKRPAT